MHACIARASHEKELLDWVWSEAESGGDGTSFPKMPDADAEVRAERAARQIPVFRASESVSEPLVRRREFG